MDHSRQPVIADERDDLSNNASSSFLTMSD